MKKAKTGINFTEDKMTMFGEEQEVVVTSSGHYALPLNSSRTILNNVVTNNNTKITLVTETGIAASKTAWKLHYQFGHASKDKLIKLIRRAGRDDEGEVIKCLDDVEKECEICQVYAKPSPRPVVSLPHANYFNETVAMDLFFFKGSIVLHMIDHLTRFSLAKICNSKKPAEIIRGIFESWITIFGSPGKFLMDNSREFANNGMMKTAEAMNIRILHTSAESPWSNGLVERHNCTLKYMLEKIMADGRMSIAIALPWALQAKNSLDNVHGFSPAQLTFGQNPSLPSVLGDKPPALEERDAEDLVTAQLEAMRKARQAFILAESTKGLKI